ncbi:sulfotransferase family protein [Thiocapsa marina]|uniref:Sulfotransferase n=1 Tax=Thiocapsa marina 5811 TaxID=768671 RepID=F9UAR3_9GAMM|nr:sulfotransferase [Thiocapsa marina]EGV18531.1 sulfotransferase [Thiocapsa marina 5811]
MHQRMGVEPDSGGPVFVVGMNGSGTTMLSDCLDNSTELYVFPFETVTIPLFIKKLHRFGPLDDAENLKRLFLAFKKTSAFRRPILKESSRFEDVREPTFFGVIDAVYRTLATTHKDTCRWLEKSPMNVQFMGEIAEHVPGAKFVHIYRDGRDVALSNARRFHHDLESTMYRWVQVVRIGRRDGAKLGPDRYFELSYEALTEDPEHWMRGVSAFIGIPYSDALLRSAMPWMSGPKRNPVAEKVGGISRNSGKWRSEIPAAKLVALERLGGRLLSDLGYQTDFPLSEQPPGDWKRAFWEAKDYFLRARVAVLRGHLLARPGRTLYRWVERVRYRWNQKI